MLHRLVGRQMQSGFQHVSHLFVLRAEIRAAHGQRSERFLAVEILQALGRACDVCSLHFLAQNRVQVHFGVIIFGYLAADDLPVCVVLQSLVIRVKLLR